jgi:heptosyltransferase-2
MQDILVIRFGALGDLCLLGWTLSGLASAEPVGDRRVTLVTKARFADLARRFHGVDAVEAFPEPGSLADLVRLARRLRARRWHRIVDTHGVLRSRMLTGMLGRRHAVLRKDTAARLKLLRGGGADGALGRHMRDRLDDVFERAGLPRPVTGQPPLVPVAPRDDRSPLGLAPGAQWDPKRWPDAHWASLASRLLADTDHALRIFLGPREATWWPTSALAAAVADTPRVEIIRDRGLLDVADALAGCRRLVCNDSGLMHLAEAVGTPVHAFFGPTVRAFGYAPQLPTSRLLETTDLDCRPCSRNGKRPCHRGDLACLERIAPASIWRDLMVAVETET